MYTPGDESPPLGVSGFVRAKAGWVRKKRQRRVSKDSAPRRAQGNLDYIKPGGPESVVPMRCKTAVNLPRPGLPQRLPRVALRLRRGIPGWQVSVWHKGLPKQEARGTPSTRTNVP